MKLLVVVDIQKDFIDGSLGTEEAVSIVNNVNNKIKNFDDIVVYTRDAHDDNYMNHQEGKNLPVIHCKKGTPGFEIQVDTSIKNKPSDKNINYFKDYYDKDAFASIECGIYRTMHRYMCACKCYNNKSICPRVKNHSW